ncbi:hypothetical protein BJL95_08865 [Methylomonas sp. LWB]|uniref:hypothetical protein n=1 Tax=Methylomonas sp. LWB TaxID=1905845 RepID=UPI0008DA7F6B|nr:hypothetical protein [Methylomonas sp. LWB]OHX38403.1 hypothetical protein BJL95_08865 [Methylomonas sp. LWB]
MKRIHLFEIEDQSWCPGSIRDSVTDFLQYIVRIFNLYDPIVSLLWEAITREGRPSRVIDLCAGGVTWLAIIDKMKFANGGLDMSVTLTDLYPNVEAFRSAKARYPNDFEVCADSIDAANVSVDLQGFRTLFSSFHHFTPDLARSILQNAVDRREGIAVFESTQRHILLIVYMLFTPLLVWVLTPWIRPFRWSRLIFTYLIPVVPFVVLFDGVVSCLRTYSVAELQEIVATLNAPEYRWKIGLKRVGFLPVGVTYLIGYPSDNHTGEADEKFEP